MKTRELFKYLMMFVVAALMSTALSSCGSDDDDNGSGSSTGIYGTWVSTLEDGDVFTMVVTKNSMQLSWTDGAYTETEIYDSFNYDESTHKVVAHFCKSIYSGPGGSREETEDDVLEFYVNWIDNNHITVGGKSGETWSDYGTLARQ